MKASMTRGGRDWPGETTVWLAASTFHVSGKLAWSQETAWFMRYFSSGVEFAIMVNSIIQGLVLYFQ